MLSRNDRHCLLRAGVVASDGQDRPFRAPVGAGQVPEVEVVDVVEALHDDAAHQVPLDQLAGGRRLVVQLGDVAVALGVVVARVDDDLAAQGLDGHPVDRGQRDRHDHDVAGGSRAVGRGRSSMRAELFDQSAQSLGTATVAHHDVVARVQGQSGDGAADVAASDESDGGHGRRNGQACRIIPDRDMRTRLARPEYEARSPARGLRGGCRA